MTEYMGAAENDKSMKIYCIDEVSSVCWDCLFILISK